jgi:predicted unusual protein kinase regulating ubiquinone biosynthesis (AarF/ABC1/UbiB family)
MPAAWGSFCVGACASPLARAPRGAVVAPRADPSQARGDAQALALIEELGGHLGRMKGAGAKVVQFLSMVAFERERSDTALGTLPVGRRPLPFARLRRVLERELDAPVRELFASFEENPFAMASLGQVHRARTHSGDDVAVKVQYPDVADAIEADLRNIGLVSPILGRLAPGADARALVAEVRERISDELDYELEAQHQRRLERRFRGHPHVRVARVHTDISTRRVLVTEYVEGLGPGEIKCLAEAERDRVGEIIFRFYFGLAWRDGVVAGDPHPDNCLLCADGRLCLLDFGLVRDLEPDYLEGERDIMRAIAARNPQGVHDGLATLGYLPEPREFEPEALLEHLATAAEWLLGRGFRRLDPGEVQRVVDAGYPPRSRWFALMRAERIPPATLLLRRMEIQVLSVLGELRAGGEWGAIAAEHHSGEPVCTALGREDRAFFDRR